MQLKRFFLFCTVRLSFISRQYESNKRNIKNISYYTSKCVINSNEWWENVNCRADRAECMRTNRIKWRKKTSWIVNCWSQTIFFCERLCVAIMTYKLNCVNFSHFLFRRFLLLLLFLRLFEISLLKNKYTFKRKL